MSRTTKHWILLTNVFGGETIIPPEGDLWPYEIVPNNEIKKGDIVYLWWIAQNYFFGWGEIIEAPRLVKSEVHHSSTEIEIRKRMSIMVNRKNGFRNLITSDMMQQESTLKNMIPTGYDDLYAIPLRPGQANYLNDFIRKLGDKPPLGSTTLVVHTHEPQLIKTLGDFSEMGWS